MYWPKAAIRMTSTSVLMALPQPCMLNTAAGRGQQAGLELFASGHIECGQCLKAERVGTHPAAGGKGQPAQAGMTAERTLALLLQHFPLERTSKPSKKQHSPSTTVSPRRFCRCFWLSARSLAEVEATGYSPAESRGGRPRKRHVQCSHTYFDL